MNDMGMAQLINYARAAGAHSYDEAKMWVEIALFEVGDGKAAAPFQEYAEFIDAHARNH